MTPDPSDLDGFARRHGGTVERTDDAVRVWIDAPPADLDEVGVDAARLGLRRTRTLYQMRVPLPPPHRPDAPHIVTRPIDLQADAAAWVRVNNAAFSWHPDQGGRTVDDLLAAAAEPWFDAEGFRILEIDGEMAGFCWTKVHADDDPPLGEIYVIAAAPKFAGRGLGLALTLDGLDHLHDVRGTTVGMLYVEADNAAALRTYGRIGFERYLTRTCWVTDVVTTGAG